jgi:hypothetical protein
MRLKSEFAHCDALLVARVVLSVSFAVATAPLGAAQDNNGTTPVADRPPEARTLGSKPPRHKLQITPQCQISADTVYIYADFEITLNASRTAPELRRYLKRAFREGRGRYLWNIECSRRTRECRGFHMDLTPSDYDEPIKGSDVATMEGASMRAITDSLFVIEWGFYQLTVDEKRDGVLTLRFAANGFSGSGVGRCGSAMSIGF